MAYVQTEKLDYATLTQNTKMRFMELEMVYALPILNEITSKMKIPASHMLAHYLAGAERTTLKEDLIHAFSSKKFHNPTRDELIQYFRYKGLGVAAVVKYAKCSPNTVVGYKDKYPNFYPVFKSWALLPGLVTNWDTIKSTLNLFNDKMVHSKHSHSQYIGMEETIIEIKEVKATESKYAPLIPKNEAPQFQQGDNFDEWIIKHVVTTMGVVPGDYVKRVEAGEFDHIMKDLEKYLDPKHLEEYNKVYQPE